MTTVDLRDDTTAFGDMALSAAWRLSSAKDAGRSVALRAMLNIPTGKESALAGSGGTEGSLQLALRDPKTFSSRNVTLFGAAGALYIGNDTFLGDLRRPLVGFGTVGAGWAPASWVAIKFQAGGHTALSREREFKPLSWTINVMGGATFALPEGVDMDLGMFETVLNETAPDVGFQLGFRKRFGGTGTFPGYGSVSKPYWRKWRSNVKTDRIPNRRMVSKLDRSTRLNPRRSAARRAAEAAL